MVSPVSRRSCRFTLIWTAPRAKVHAAAQQSRCSTAAENNDGTSARRAHSSVTGNDLHEWGRATDLQIQTEPDARHPLHAAGWAYFRSRP